MGVITHVLNSVGPGSSVAVMPLAGATVIKNDPSGIATNLSTITTSITQFNTASDSNGLMDLQFAVQDTGTPATEYYFTHTLTNDSSGAWYEYRQRLGFFTAGSFIDSSTGDGLDFDTTTVLGGTDFDPPPTNTFPPRVGASPPIGEQWNANELFYGISSATTSQGVIGTSIYATPNGGVNILTFSMDIPDWNAVEMPAGAQISGGYIFTLRMFGTGLDAAAGRRHRNSAWVDQIMVSA